MTLSVNKNRSHSLAHSELRHSNVSVAMFTNSNEFPMTVIERANNGPRHVARPVAVVMATFS
jgi:hypothetical protein